ncbi:hypothetical protein D9756_008046 [Leucocoprinus leucothites]|uniref:Uncharacterized protein n=1 Tax=Leucocoprinus leucothites TaxID=201217 RepID=A0A8H5D495_9AGAR|nr:hypothetical protein D9756_008046 [Leucoagaricus leucothites]
MKSFVILAAASPRCFGRTHKVRFNNHCDSGTPMLTQWSNALSRGEDYTVNGPLNSAIAYLDNERRMQLQRLGMHSD